MYLGSEPPCGESGLERMTKWISGFLECSRKVKEGHRIHHTIKIHISEQTTSQNR